MNTVTQSFYDNDYAKACTMVKSFMEIFLKKFDLAIKIKNHLGQGKIRLV